MGAESKRTPGKPFGKMPAETWNGMVDAGDAYRASQLGGGAGPRFRARPTDIIKVRNDTGANRTAGEVVRINGTPLTAITAEHPWVKGEAIAAAKPFGILLKNIEHSASDPKYGELQVSGACMATVNIVSTSDRFADIAAATYVLKSGPTGPVELLYAPASTGNQTCLVTFRTNQSTFRVGKTSGALTVRSGTTAGSGTVLLQYLSGTTITAQTGGSVTCYNWSTEAVATDTYVDLFQDDFGTWWLAGADGCGD